MTHINTLNYAIQLDQNDPLQSYRDKFHIPVRSNGNEYLYLCGNSLGLQPRTVRKHIEQELNDWSTLGVEGHFHAKNPWMPYHEFLTSSMAKIVGAKNEEVVVMNSLTVNLHFMMVSFYNPTAKRNKILIEGDAFPSDKYAVHSQIKYHGYNSEECMINLRPRNGEINLRTEDILEIIDQQGDEIALVMIGGVNYYTGQKYDMKSITKAAQMKGAKVGFDLAHGVGNVKLELHEWNVDFAVWCSYKYLNAGPGAVGGCFVHENHRSSDLPRFAGWWGHEKETRFKMPDDYIPIKGAEGWQLSNAPILSMASLMASLEIYEEVGMEQLIAKSKIMTGYMEFLLNDKLGDKINIFTTSNPEERGCQLSLSVVGEHGKEVFDQITELGVIADWREPDVIRVAPIPLYNTYQEVYEFVSLLEGCL